VRFVPLFAFTMKTGMLTRPHLSRSFHGHIKKPFIIDHANVMIVNKNLYASTATPEERRCATHANNQKPQDTLCATREVDDSA